MRLEECLEKGLIKYEMAEIAAYNSAFHAGRALLFAKG
jgi:uncharacterized protein (UPF0332 family)